MKHSVSVVIPNFNGKPLLEAHLPSVFGALNQFGGAFEVLVADDASTDGSLAFLKKNYPQVTVVENATNRGFSSNINSGLREAKGDLVLALNSDVSLDSNYFEHLLPLFDQPQTFGVMGALCNPSTHRIEDGAKLCEFSWLGSLRSTRNLVSVGVPTLPSLFLSGANALMDRKKLAVIGFYDELFDPFYNEDVELGIRAWRMGWKCYFDSRAKAYHSPSQTIKATASSKKIRVISMRNRFFLYDIHLSQPQRSGFFAGLFLGFISRWLWGDWAFYQALSRFFEARSRASLSRTLFDSLKPPFSFYDALKVIRRYQKGYPCEVF